MCGPALGPEAAEDEDVDLGNFVDGLGETSNHSDVGNALLYPIHVVAKIKNTYIVKSFISQELTARARRAKGPHP